MEPSILSWRLALGREIVAEMGEGEARRCRPNRRRHVSFSLPASFISNIPLPILTTCLRWMGFGGRKDFHVLAYLIPRMCPDNL